MDSNSRSLAKAISYRILGSVSTALIYFAFSGRVTESVGVGFVDLFVKIALYYVHERLWNHVSFGRQRPPEYEI